MNSSATLTFIDLLRLDKHNQESKLHLKNKDHILCAKNNSQSEAMNMKKKIRIRIRICTYTNVYVNFNLYVNVYTYIYIYIRTCQEQTKELYIYKEYVTCIFNYMSVI